MASPQVVALPRLRLVCRALDPAIDDADLIVAEAGALLVWGRTQGRVSAPWLVVGQGTLEVAVPAPATAPLPDGTTDRWVTAGRWAALDGRAPRREAIEALADALRAAPPESLVQSDEPVLVRLAGSVVTAHLRIEEPR